MNPMIDAGGVYDLYLMMKARNDSFDDVYQEGKFWGRINETIKDRLKNSDLREIKNSSINRKFAGPDPANRQIYRALLNLYFKEIKKIDTLGFLEKHCEPVFGGTYDQELYPFPHGALLYPFKEQRPMSLDFLQSTEEVLTIVNAFQKKFRRFPEVIVELGGGYGRLGYVIRKMLPDCVYVNIDLPEALACCHFYLSNVLQGEVVDYAVSSQAGYFSREILKQSKVWTLGTQEIEKIQDKSADVFINIYGFAEMPRAAINNYLSHAVRLTQGLIYIKQRKVEHNRLDEEQIKETDYQVLDEARQIMKRDTTLYPDFFEALYQYAD